MFSCQKKIKTPIGCDNALYTCKGHEIAGFQVTSIFFRSKSENQLQFLTFKLDIPARYSGSHPRNG